MSPPDAAGAIARALLYEGISLYPYRPSALKNQQRWFFGGVYPLAWSQAQDGVDPQQLSAEALLIDFESVTATCRFLQFHGDEAIEREVTLALRAGEPPAVQDFRFEPGVSGQLRLASSPLAPSLHRLRVEIDNTSSAACPDRESMLPHALASTHVVLQASGGRWISQLDPPPELAAAAQGCAQSGLFPVLVGDAARADTLLASPILLSDFPGIAPQSPGDLFDATEIDEILTLRVLTLTDAEKREAAAASPRVRALLERVEALTPEAMQRLHGTVRPVAGAPAVGARVRLRPGPRGEALDFALAGRIATVTAVESDFDGGVHVVVTVDDDPGADLGRAGFHGHRFFFRPDEVEPA